MVRPLQILLIAFVPFASRAGTLAYTTEIPYPTRYDVRRSSANPNLVVAIPREFTTRTTGQAFNTGGVGVVQRITLHAGATDTVDLRTHDGAVVTARAGGRVTLGGRQLMVLGWRNGDYLLHDPARRETLRFVRK